jgi:two-component system OmpR family sensor kinase
MPNPVDTDKVAAVGPEPSGPAIGLDADGLPSVPRPTTVPAVPDAPDARRNGLRGWPAVFSSTRTRLLVIFFALLAIFGAGTTFAIREILEIRLDDRTQAALRQEVQEVQRLLQIGRNPETARPFTSLEAALTVAHERQVQSPEEGFLFMVGDEVYLDRLRAFPGAPEKKIPEDAIATFAAFSARGGAPGEQLSGKFTTSAGEASYRAVRVTVGEQTGAFVVAILPQGEQRSIRELQTYGALVTFGAAVLAAALAWFLVGRVTAPVQQLTETARSISGGDLSRRIQVRGTSEAAEMAETFNDMLDRLEAVYRSQLEFLRAAGHELRTPLTVATGHLEVMGKVDEEQQATVTLVLDELGRMTRMVEDLHSLAEAEHPDYLAPQPIDMRELAHELIVKASALGERDWQLDAADSGLLVADRDRILQAVLNLADNAVKNTDPGATIAIGVTARGQEVNIWVRDTGVGIEASELDRIFHRFVRGRDAGRRYRGAGLGLAIVETVAEAHGGRVSVESEPGVGSRFAIVLPWRRG